jgi:hypothetical protein
MGVPETVVATAAALVTGAAFSSASIMFISLLIDIDEALNMVITDEIYCKRWLFLIVSV